MIRQDDLLNLSAKLSGFLLDDNGVKKLAKTKADGFKAVVEKPTKQATLNYWHGAKETISWDYQAIYRNGKKYGKPNALTGYYIEAVAATNDKLVLLTYYGGGYQIVFCNKSFTAVLAQSTALSDYYAWVTKPQFNKSATKLVFIALSSALDIQAPPFSTTLAGDGQDSAFNLNVSNGDPLLKAAFRQTTIGSSKWQAVIRCDISMVNMTVTANIIEQYACHVYKHSLSSTYSQTTENIDEFTTKTTTNSSGSQSLTPLHNTDYVTEIWFDKADVEQTEVFSSAITLIGDGNYVAIDYDPVSLSNPWTLNYNYSFNVSITNRHTSVFGVFETITTKAQSATVSAVQREGGDFEKHEVFSQSRTNFSEYELFGFNPLLNNILKKQITYTFTPYSSSDDYELPPSYVPESTVSSTIPTYTTDGNITASQVLPFDISFAIPSGGTCQKWGGLSAFGTALERDYFIIIERGALIKRDLTVWANCDRFGNSMYAMANQWVVPYQYDCKIYKVNFVDETPAENAEIKAIVTSPDKLLGVI